MSITKVTDSDVKTLVESAYKQAFKDDTLTAIDYSVFNVGTTEDITAKREKFTGALIGEISKTYYINRFKTSDLKSPWFVDSEKYGAVTQWLTVSLPSAIENKAMKSFASGDTVGTFDIALPTVTNRVYEQTVSWALPLTITGEQWNTAFKNESNLNSFVMFVMSQFEGNALVHDYELGNANRNAMICRKVELTDDSTLPKGFINLLSGYCKAYGVSDGSYTLASVRNSESFNKYVISRIGLYAKRFKEFNNFYNSSGDEYAVDTVDVVTQINDEFWTDVNSVVAETYRNNWLEPDNLETVGSWQKIGNPLTVKMKDSSSTEHTHDNIVGIIADKYACMHTNVNMRTASRYMPLEDLTHYEKQYVDRYMINLDRKVIIFSVAPVTVATSGGTTTYTYTVNGETITE